nr:MAG TPA: hypothetical protein [Caudoviricetes sp.]DAZ25445.1 MAG TPA: hypothetical protein [Caudoviricetes sp.]
MLAQVLANLAGYYLFHTLYILIGETFLFCKDTLFPAHILPFHEQKA